MLFINASPQHPCHRIGTLRAANRRGSIYLVATSGLVLVAGVGLAAMGILRADRTTHLNIHETAELRRLAMSGLELAAQRIADESDWRETVDPVTGWSWTISDATIIVVPTDPLDDDLANDPFHDVLLTAWASRDEARQGKRVTLELLEAGGPTLELSLAATGDVKTTGTVVLNIPRAVYTLSNLDVKDNGTIQGDAYAAGSITTSGGSSISGTAKSNAPLINFPDPDRAFAEWIALATSISTDDLEYGDTLEDITLSPTENPFGDPNPQGIYHIDDIKTKLIIDSVNITGTLIVTRAHSGIEIINRFNAAPVEPASPVLMFQGDTTLDDADSRFTITGLWLHQGNLAIETDMSGNGPFIVLGDVNINNSTVRIEPTGLVESAPPAGFSTKAAPAVSEQTWVRAID